MLIPDRGNRNRIPLKISIITVSYNAANTIGATIASVARQTNQFIEHIIVDGASHDGTLNVIRDNCYSYTRWVSEPDAGLYDAMNKGLKLATGDVVGFLNADDMFARPDALELIAKRFTLSNCDIVFGDLAVVEQNNINKVSRFFGARHFKPRHMRMGYMPPHPTVYVKRDILLQEDGFDTSLNIGADFELMLRLLVRRRSSYSHIPATLVKLRAGGVSTSGLKSTVQINKDFGEACRKNGIWTHPLLLYARYFTKLTQYIRRPSDLPDT